MPTLAEKQTELAEWREALRALRFGKSYAQGDRSYTRQDLPEVERHVARLSREVNELTAEGNGANNPLFVTPEWR